MGSEIFIVEEGAVMLEPDIRQYFPDSEAVNNALRCLIPLLPKRRRAKIKQPNSRSPDRYPAGAP